MQSKILHYMRQMAVITPYAQFIFKFVSDTPEYALSLSLSHVHIQNNYHTFYMASYPFIVVMQQKYHN